VDKVGRLAGRVVSRIIRLASTAFFGAVWLASASGVRAATLSLVTDDLVYDPGDTITIELVGDSQGATDYTLFAAILKPDPSVLSNLALQRFAPPSSDGVPWTLGATSAPTCGPAPSECFLMNMIHLSSTGQSLPVGVDPALEPFTYAVLTGTAGLPGTYTFGWVTVPTRRVDFFGLTSAPGVTITITGEAPPPPPPPPPPVIPPPVIPPPVNPAPPAVPEPGGLLLFAAGVACVRLRLRRAARA
jgi:hypothetical protein